jgi:uncharacterized membrane protein HdeD (DUF308 family)
MSTYSDAIRYEVKNWWWFLIIGALSVAAGVAIVSRPVEGYVGLSILFTWVMLGTGISQILFALSVSDFMKGWGWTLASGIFDLALGTYLLIYPAVTMATLPFFVGFYLVFRAIYLIGTSIDLNFLGAPGWGWILAGGIGLLILGMLTLRFPAAGAAGIVGVSGSAFMLSGVFNMLLSFQLRSLKRAIEKPKEKGSIKVGREKHGALYS